MHGLHIAEGVVRFRDDLDAPHRPDEVQLEPILTVVCRTDLELAAGCMNLTGVPGHEFVARNPPPFDRLRASEIALP